MFTPKAPGILTITAVYVPSSSDTTFKGSQGTTTISPGAQSTSTNVVCPGPIVVNQGSTCTVTVDSTATSGASSPTGSVSLTVNAYVSPLTISCTLSPATGPSSTCSVQFTGSTAGSATITATFVGNSAYVTSHGSATLTVGLRTTSTTVSCDSPVAIGQTSTCTAIVTDTSATGTPITPAGTISFSSSGTAGSFADSQCNLSGLGVTASCTATFLDSTVMESTTISASYASSDSVHSDSATTVGSIIIVNQRQSTIAISCQPTATVVGNYTTCIAVVSDSNPTTGTTPTGSVSFLNGTGTFATCTLSNGRCLASYTP
ncbi:MAG TPA: hypothetical protein VFV92_08630, partial [Candidatus Bathyarchaeia archaeon]|nr:hypothetical protein [Candidatus Bathyarchaeia archaeon]